MQQAFDKNAKTSMWILWKGCYGTRLEELEGCKARQGTKSEKLKRKTCKRSFRAGNDDTLDWYQKSGIGQNSIWSPRYTPKNWKETSLTKTAPIEEISLIFYFSSLQWPQRKDSSGGWIECEEIKLIVQRGNFVGEVGFGIKKARAIQPVIAVGRVLTI